MDKLWRVSSRAFIKETLLYQQCLSDEVLSKSDTSISTPQQISQSVSKPNIFRTFSLDDLDLHQAWPYNNKVSLCQSKSESSSFKHATFGNGQSGLQSKSSQLQPVVYINRPNVPDSTPDSSELQSTLVINGPSWPKSRLDSLELNPPTTVAGSSGPDSKSSTSPSQSQPQSDCHSNCEAACCQRNCGSCCHTNRVSCCCKPSCCSCCKPNCCSCCCQVSCCSCCQTSCTPCCQCCQPKCNQCCQPGCSNHSETPENIDSPSQNIEHCQYKTKSRAEEKEFSINPYSDERRIKKEAPLPLGNQRERNEGGMMEDVQKNSGNGDINAQCESDHDDDDDIVDNGYDDRDNYSGANRGKEDGNQYKSETHKSEVVTIQPSMPMFRDKDEKSTIVENTTNTPQTHNKYGPIERNENDGIKSKKEFQRPCGTSRNAISRDSSHEDCTRRYRKEIDLNHKKNYKKAYQYEISRSSSSSSNLTSREESDPKKKQRHTEGENDGNRGKANDKSPSYSNKTTPDSASTSDIGQKSSHEGRCRTYRKEKPLNHKKNYKKEFEYENSRESVSKYHACPSGSNESCNTSQPDNSQKRGTAKNQKSTSEDCAKRYRKQTPLNHKKNYKKEFKHERPSEDDAEFSNESSKMNKNNETSPSKSESSPISASGPGIDQKRSYEDCSKRYRTKVDLDHKENYKEAYQYDYETSEASSDLSSTEEPALGKKKKRKRRKRRKVKYNESKTNQEAHQHENSQTSTEESGLGKKKGRYRMQPPLNHGENYKEKFTGCKPLKVNNVSASGSTEISMASSNSSVNTLHSTLSQISLTSLLSEIAPTDINPGGESTWYDYVLGRAASFKEKIPGVLFSTDERLTVDSNSNPYILADSEESSSFDKSVIYHGFSVLARVALAFSNWLSVF